MSEEINNPEEEFEDNIDVLIAEKRYKEIANDAFYDAMYAQGLLNSVITRSHRISSLVVIDCPDIITTNESRVLKEKLAETIKVLTEIHDRMDKLQQATKVETKKGK